MAMIHKTYQVRAYTSAAGYDRLDHVLRNCARLYNAALEEWQSAYRHKGHALSVSDMRRIGMPAAQRNMECARAI